MSDAQKRIKRALDLDRAATPGPWRMTETRWVDNWPDGSPQPEYLMEWEQVNEHHRMTREQTANDAAFIAESRTLLPAIAADLEKALAQLAQAQKEIEALRAIPIDGRIVEMEVRHRRECATHQYSSSAMGDRADLLMWLRASLVRLGLGERDKAALRWQSERPIDGEWWVALHPDQRGILYDEGIYKVNVFSDRVMQAGMLAGIPEERLKSALWAPSCGAPADPFTQPAAAQQPREGEAEKAREAGGSQPIKNSNGEVLGFTKPAWLVDLERLRAELSPGRARELGELEALHRVVSTGRGEANVPDGLREKMPELIPGYVVRKWNGRWRLVVSHEPPETGSIRRAQDILAAIDTRGAEILAAHRDGNPDERAS